MKRCWFICLVLCCLCCSSFGQGTLTGTVRDSSGSRLAGVTIRAESNSALGTNADANGNYTLKIPDSTARIIRFTFLGRKTLVEAIQLKNGEIRTLNVLMKQNINTLDKVEVGARALKDKDYYMETQKRNSAATLDFVSGESMRKTGDIDIASAVSTIAGVSTNGSYINVRGIGDRFVKTTINGSVIPTLDPFTNNISLDIFSTNIVDNVVLTKTASPDLRGDWSGAFISINTNSPPDRLIINVESDIGFNSQNTFRDIISSDRSSTDWMGFDKSFRERSQNSFVQLVNYPISQKQEFFALGLGPYFNSIGITADTPNSSWTETDFKLGLVQLGLLSKNQFNNSTAVAAAKLKYDQGPFHGEAFDIINAPAVKSNQSFPNTWNTVNRKAPPAFYQSFSIGNQFKLFGRDLGFITGFQYSSFTEADPNSKAYALINPVLINGSVRADTINQVISKETNSWSALFNVKYTLNSNNFISLLFMPNIMGENIARTGINTKDLYHPLTAREEIYQHYESRRQLIYQVRTEHFIPSAEMKLEFNASYTKGNSNAPDVRDVYMPISIYKNGNDLGGERIWQYFSDNILDTRLSAEMPIANKKKNLIRKIKAGIDFLRNDKRSDQYNYWIREDYDEWFTPGHQTMDPFGQEAFSIKPWVTGDEHIHAVQKYYSYIGAPVNHNFGYSMVSAAYAMADFEVLPGLRLSGGARVEQTNIFWDVDLYDSLGLPVNDPRRHWFDSKVLNNPVQINITHLLPCGTLIYKLRNDIQFPFLLRLNYSQGVGRPSLRELAGMNTYDFEFQTQTLGNPNLKVEHINNYDLRFEFYFKSGDYFSSSAFFKDFTNNIEFCNFGPTFGDTWVNNTQTCWVEGLELDGRKKLNKYFDIGANITLAASRSHFEKFFPYQSGGFISGGIADHPMFGQAPYVVNAICSYASSKEGLSINLLYNVQGPRMVIEGGGIFPNVYEMPRNLMDFMISKKLGKHYSVRLKVKDLFNSPVVRKYRFDEGYILGYDTYTYGTNFIISIIFRS
ncbi:MAG: carboxypeptidase-like regulatory domain-containing protein [Bacteroidia bacterium]